MSKSTSLIRLEPAYFWECPSCKQTHFIKVNIRPINLDDPNELARVRDNLGLKPWEPLPEDFEGDVYEHPTTVHCWGCGLDFDSHAGEMDDLPPPIET